MACAGVFARQLHENDTYELRYNDNYYNDHTPRLLFLSACSEREGVRWLLNDICSIIKKILSSRALQFYLMCTGSLFWWEIFIQLLILKAFTAGSTSTLYKASMFMVLTLNFRTLDFSWKAERGRAGWQLLFDNVSQHHLFILCLFLAVFERVHHVRIFYLTCWFRCIWCISPGIIDSRTVPFSLHQSVSNVYNAPQYLVHHRIY